MKKIRLVVLIALIGFFAVSCEGLVGGEDVTPNVIELPDMNGDDDDDGKVPPPPGG